MIVKGNIMKKTIIALSILPALAFSASSLSDEFMRADIKSLQEQGLPTPESGVKVVPNDSISMEKWQRNQYLAQENEMKSKGYINETSDRAYELIHIKEEILSMTSKKKSFTKPNESDLREHKGDIVFAYSYVGVPGTEIVDYYGIAPVGTYVKEPQTGWTGAVELFRSGFANCAFTENNILASHGAASVSEDYVEYDVNGKITIIDVQGTDSTGYLYKVNWFDNNFIRTLECATKDYSDQFTRKSIELAKRIDSTQSA